MATLNITTALEWTEGSATFSIGSKTTPVQITYTGPVQKGGVTLGANTTQNGILTIGAGQQLLAMSAFAITADKAFLVQFEAAAPANNSTFKISANGWLVIVGKEVITYNAAGDFGATAPLDIASINVRTGADATTIYWWAW